MSLVNRRAHSNLFFLLRLGSMKTDFSSCEACHVWQWIESTSRETLVEQPGNASRLEGIE